jgi:hypothetical protein
MYGISHPDYATSLNCLGNLNFKIEKYQIADQYYNNALQIRKNVFGANSHFYTSTLTNLALVNFKLKNNQRSFDCFEKVFVNRTNNVKENFSWLTFEDKNSFWKKEDWFFKTLITFCTRSNIQLSISGELAYNSLLISKSLIMETSREIDSEIAHNGNDDLRLKFSEMKKLRLVCSKLQSEGSTDLLLIENYKVKADSLDKILVNYLGEYAASKRKFEITWKDVQSNLSTNEAAIEYARYYDDKDSSYKYLALVVRQDYQYPKLVKLGKEEDIRIANQPNAQDFSALYDLVWQATDSLLIGVNTIYYSPSGELNNVAFSALCFGTGDSLMVATSTTKRGVKIELESASKRSCDGVLLDKYVLHQLTTTRYLADGTLKKNLGLNNTITLLGGINYDDIPAADTKATHEESEQDFALNVNLTSLGKDKRRKRSSSGIGKPMKYLEGTSEEVREIATKLNGIWSVQTLSERGASENALKKQLEKGSPGVLHIATHGFAFPDVEGNDNRQGFNNERPAYNISEDPMVRCGLMLSGSNISWTGNPKKMIEQTGDDGILTAAEVSNMNLSNTKLVVLSACQTGLGKIEGSEGTFGLKRGFKLAGVEQLIVSLWSVPDKETMELMTLFYTDLTKTLNPVISFEKAQKEMRNKYPTEPEKWAGFVLVR